MQTTVETCTSICINALQKSIKKLLARDYPDSTPEETYAHTMEELQKFSVNDQIFEYDAMKNYLGGYRWFFLCPKCKHRASKLFLPPMGAKNRDHKYYCKVCHRLKNQSAIMGANSMYKKVTRPLRRMKEIEDKISRGHLKSERVQDLLDEYETLERSLKETKEYRLYSFKKTHNLI
jgi:HAMP domain-containing protein